MKVIAFYLPQFHSIPENDKWWGEGFTEWNNVKKAKALYSGHNQPRIPLNKNYYNLLNDDTLEWQVKLAKEYGVYGFCSYHYWFNGKLLLEKPMENYLKNKNLDLPFCFSWANEEWTKAWVEGKSEILMAQDFNDKNDWVEHFNYLLPFFKDERYMKEDGKPIFIIYVPHIIEPLEEMLNCWNNLAKENGFPGIVFIYQSVMFHLRDNARKDLFDYGIEFQPGYIEWKNQSKATNNILDIRKKVSRWVQKNLHLYVSLSSIASFFNRKDVKTIKKYSDVWQQILDCKPDNENMLPGAIKDWDNTPRYGRKGKVFENATPMEFKKYFKKQIINARDVYKKDVIFMFAWNEWGEGGYLEPDEKYGYQFLEGIKSSLEECGEFPDKYESDIKFNRG